MVMHAVELDHPTEPSVSCVFCFYHRVVITQMQALSRQKPGMSTFAVVRQMYQDSGISGFFKGLMPSMVMVVNPTIQYIIYESLVAWCLDWRNNSRQGRRSTAAHQQQAKPSPMALGALDIFVLSALAKIGATLVTYPLLVVKNRLQVCAAGRARFAYAAASLSQAISLHQGMHCCSMSAAQH